MIFVRGQRVLFEGVEYVVRSAQEELDESDLPGVPRIATLVILDAVDGSHSTTLDILDPDVLKILEETA